MEEDYSSPPLSKVNVDQNGKQLILPSGYIFSPLDSEVVVHYLKKKILNQELPAHIIATIDVYSYDSPNQLPLSEFKYGLRMSGISSPQDRHTISSSRAMVVVGMNWLVKAMIDNDQVIGYKRRLAFYFLEPLQEMK
ncbi:NAC domain-containing protein 2 [Camellia lanceoleosa]|uniref:NAC domain-containing protein 2 n=1 Tax=Camellia lanceoleosa TaxID=1840588 RepID=A0ACC0G488_9ERIC|nr:NAC domain-containing protein 2 [Camellia lanceoleosa]